MTEQSVSPGAKSLSLKTMCQNQPGGLVEVAVDALNKTPKEQVLHGEGAPEEVREDAYVRFMLLQDNAKKLTHTTTG